MASRADAPDARACSRSTSATPTGWPGSCEAARLVAAATSFGGLHTTADRRAQWGDDTAPGFVRLSCGIEDTADLVADIAAALDAAGRPSYRVAGPVAGPDRRR